MFYYAYALLCRTATGKQEKYIGSCQDLRKRMKRHERGEVKTTKKFDKIELVYYEACLSKTDAIKRERQLKTGFGRGYLKRRIEDYLKNKRE